MHSQLYTKQNPFNQESKAYKILEDLNRLKKSNA